jgi:hypothetical protein
MASQFLTGREARMMRNDWKMLLASQDAIGLTLRSKQREVNPGDVDDEPVADPVYGVVDGGVAVIVDTPIRAVQRFVDGMSQDLKKWEILKVGDCVFYMDVTPVIATETSVDGIKVIEIVDAYQQKWVPVPNQPAGLQAYMRMKLGVVGQIAQVLVCRLKKD